MIKLEADIKKKTINTFVKLCDRLRPLNIENIRTIAEELCNELDKEVEKDDFDDWF